MASIPQNSALAAAQPSVTQTVIAIRDSRTLQQYVQTLFWTFAAIAACAACYALEKYVARDLLGWISASTYRLFKNPAELPMRVFGIPHILIGTLFLLSSRRMRGLTSVAGLLALAAVGVGFCWLFYEFGRVSDGVGGYDFNPLALLIFYFYFLIHGFRDEAFFYRAYGEMPKGQEKVHDRIMLVLQVLMLGLLVSLAVPAYVLFGELFPKFRHPALEAIFPASWPYAVRFASTFGPMLLVALFAIWRISRAFPDGLAGLWRAHRPILIVFLASTAIILIALVSGPWTFNAVVLMHFVGWYLFARATLKQRAPAAPPKGWWPWMRSTPTGFTVLHIGLAVVVIGLLALSSYAFGKTDALEIFIGSKAFFYWTIMHVTLSFYPR